MKFRLVNGAGPHRDRNGVLHKAGAIIESDSDLSKRYKGKFVLVEGQPDGEPEPREIRTPYDTPNTKRHPPAPTFEPKPGTAEDAVAEIDAETAKAMGGVEEEVLDEEPAPAPKKAAATATAKKKSK